MASNTTAGYVYLVTSRSLIADSVFKLGQTKTPVKQRLSALNTGHCRPDDELYEFNSWLVNDCRVWESELHKLYAARRVSREFFRFTVTDLFDIAVRLRDDKTAVSKCRMARPPLELVRLALSRSEFLRRLRYDTRRKSCVEESTGHAYPVEYVKSYFIFEIVPQLKRCERERYRTDACLTKLCRIFERQLLPYERPPPKTVDELVDGFVAEHGTVYAKNDRGQIVDENDVAVDVVSVMATATNDAAEKRVVRKNKRQILDMLAKRLNASTTTKNEADRIREWITDHVEHTGKKTDFVGLNDLKNLYKSQYSSTRTVSDKNFISIAKALFANRGIHIKDRLRYRSNGKNIEHRNVILSFTYKNNTIDYKIYTRRH